MPPINLKDLGWTEARDVEFSAVRPLGMKPARVVTEDRGIYQVVGEEGQLSAIIPGRFSHQAAHASDLPKVGDWVAIIKLPREEKALIRRILKRHSRLARKVPGREVEEQVLVANVDLVLIVHGLDRGVNGRLLERQLVMVREGGAGAVLILNKIDLCVGLDAACLEAKAVADGVRMIPVSAASGQGIEELRSLIRDGLTVVFLGTSGVGKSSLVNALLGEETQATIEVRESDSKGRHTTTSRELFLLPGGGLVIDTPGMRELQLWSSGEVVTHSFEDIEALAQGCYFRDCTHTKEPRCAVRVAVDQGTCSPARYGNYLKIRQEVAHLRVETTRRGMIERKRQTRVIQSAFNKLKRSPEWHQT